MTFTRSELEMIYQYAATDRAATVAGLAEIVPVLKDPLTKAIVKNTIDKLEKIPEPECSCFIADIKAQRPDQVQTAACCGAGAGDIAAVLRYLRFHQNNIQHAHHPGGSRVGLFSQNPLVFYCKSNGR